VSTPILPPAPLSRRRAELLITEAHGNGIDYIEVKPSDHTQLTAGFLLPLPGGADPWQLHSQPDLIQISGGERVRGITVKSVTVIEAQTLAITVDKPGDYSSYELEIQVDELDPVLRRAAFSFMAACPTDYDCRDVCAPSGESGNEPRIDTLAKDYASFRQMLLDLMAQRHPSMSDQHPADLAITILELLAFHADELSYAQDAAAAEGYLDTARRRISVRRHARLVDYSLHEGRNAAAGVHVAVTAPLTIPAGTRLLTRIPGPLPGTNTPAPVAIPDSLLTNDALAAPPFSGSVMFETSCQLVADPRNNLLRIHTWGDDEFWLPAGVGTAWLWSADPGERPGQPGTAALPPLAPGDLIIVEEARSPQTGAVADADPAARWMMRLTDVQPGSEPAYQQEYDVSADRQAILRDRTSDTEAALPVLGVRWSQADAPDRPVCVRAIMADGDPVADVCVGRGNVVLADHGATYTGVDVTPAAWPPQDAGAPGTAPIVPPLRLSIPQAPLTFQIGALGTQRTDLSGPPEAAVPALSVVAQPLVGPGEVYTPVPDLFDSGPNDLNLVAEVDDTGHGLVRFGDGLLGRFPADAVLFTATYRIGNGTAGDVGAEALAHIALPTAMLSAVAAVRNPLPASLGTDPESMEYARQIAPDYFRAEQARAVTEQDAVNAVLAVAGVRAAVAALRWTGSWYTWLIGVLPTDPADLVDTGATELDLSAPIRAQIEAAIDLVRLCGQDVDVRPPIFVGVELGLHVCAAEGQSRAAIRSLVRDALIAPALPGGGQGLLAAATMTFGKALELGEVYATVAALPGVSSVKATLLRRYQQPDNGELASGRLAVAAWEILRLDDDPSLPSRGVLYLEIDGGTA
jgi:hypothetical protein